MSMQEVREQNIALVTQTALACFVENGIEKTTIRDIAQHAGLTERSVYRYFAGKDELVIAAAYLYWDRAKELAAQLKFTASQIRQDLNCFGGFGQQGYGYNVDNLYTEIGKILGLDKRNDMIIVGAGNLGQALANYQSFNEDYGYKVMALFDVNPKLIGISVRGVKVLDTDELENFIKTHGIKIAALTIPKDQAPAIAKKMAEWGIKGFWNFAPIDLHLPDNVTVENVHLAESLMTLTYNVHNREESENE